MKKRLFTACLLILFHLSQAQEVNIFWGKENPTTSINIIGRRGDNLLGYETKGGDVKIVQYSFKDLQLKGEGITRSSLGGITAGRFMKPTKEFYLFKNKNYAFESRYDKKQDKNSLYVQEFSNDGSLTGSLKKITDISSTSKRNTGSFDFFRSEDSTKFLIVNNPPYKKYNGEKFDYKIFDENLAPLYNLSVALPYKNKDFEAADYILGNDGTIYLLAKIYFEKQDREKDESKYYYELITISPEGKGQVNEYEVKLPQKNIVDISYQLDSNQIICSGFYSEVTSHKNDIKGIFFMRLNGNTKKIEATGIKELDKDFVADITSKRKADKGRGISKTFDIKHFIRRDDGGAVIVAENSYMYTTTYCDSKGNCRTTYHYIRNNIIAININPDASIKWYANIPKYQHTTNDLGVFSSFMLMTKGSMMYFVYNDNPKNLLPDKINSQKDIYGMGVARKSTSVLVTLSESGKFSKKALFSNKENKMILQPASSFDISKREVIVPAVNYGISCCLITLKKGKSKLARFEFK